MKSVLSSQGLLPWFVRIKPLWRLLEPQADQEACILGNSRWLRNLYKNPAWWQWFTENPYWSRLWVVQELCLGSNPVFWLGATRIMTWNVFTMALSIFRKSQSLEIQGNFKYFPWLIDQCDNTRYGDSSSLQWYSANGGTLSEMIRATGTQQCEDRRDVIFAVLSLVKKPCRVDVNYDLSITELFCKVLDDIWKRRYCEWSDIDEFQQFCKLLLIRLNLGRTLRLGKIWAIPLSGSQKVTCSVTEEGKYLIDLPGYWEW
jgi:hypothetical protein